MRPILAWSLAFAASATGAALMLSATAGAPEPDIIVARDPAAVPDVELKLVVNKIREGDLLALKGDLPSARRAWAAARELGRGLWPAHEGLADSHARAKLHADAEREYAVAARLAPANAAIQVKRARNLRALGRDADALRLLLDAHKPALAPELVDIGRADPVVERAERDPWLWFVAHAIHAKQGDKPAAARALGRYAIACSPWDPALVSRAVELLRARKLVDDAVAVCRAHAKARPGTPDIHVTMGDALAEAGRLDEAAVAYSSIVDLKPGDADTHVRLASLFAKIGRVSDGRAQIAAARRLRPEIDVPPELIDAQIRIVMTWDTRTDIDLYVVDPKGEEVSYRQKRSAAGALYHVDNTTAHGPETYTMERPLAGTYRIRARFCSGTGRTNVRIATDVRGRRSEHAFVLEKQGDEASIPPLAVTPD